MNDSADYADSAVANIRGITSWQAPRATVRQTAQTTRILSASASHGSARVHTCRRRMSARTSAPHPPRTEGHRRDAK
jgi:hypothetical protein